MNIQKLQSEHIPSALALVWKVFSEFEAPDYLNMGIETFYQSIHNKDFIDNLTMYGAFEKNKIIGVIATRNKGTHIALFFVKAAYHRKGIGRKLFNEALKHNPTNKITVNSSPYAVPIYQHLGFITTGTEQLTNGLRYTPMLYIT